MSKVIIVIFLLLIVYSLGSGLFYLVKGRSDKNSMVKSLTWRIGLSLTLFVLLMIGMATGIIQPHGLLN